jgi:subtilisin family serine protease
VQLQHTYTAVFQGFAFRIQQQQQQRWQQQRQWWQQQQQQQIQQQQWWQEELTDLKDSHKHAATSNTVPDVLLSLAADPCVMAVYPERTGRLRAALMVPPKRAAAAAAVARTAPFQPQFGIGNNIRRVNAALGNKTHAAASVAVALIDTGIAEHPDLPSIMQSISCIGAGHSQDSSAFKHPVQTPVKLGNQQGLGCRRLGKHFDHIGHGTMVAGILAAKSSKPMATEGAAAAAAAAAGNAAAGNAPGGMNGVAPSTALYALHVVKPDAFASSPHYSFTLSDVIAALEWVLLHNAQQQQQQQRQQQQQSEAAVVPKIRVINLSLGDYSVSAAAMLHTILTYDMAADDASQPAHRCLKTAQIVTLLPKTWHACCLSHQQRLFCLTVMHAGVQKD